ncbi:class I SAM-dependent methyltransferase [Ammoniphilus resinae]|uniref:SAM-dependent MidA family methyltransferase n=1 Tax=Ammoniphilus resinae TaxID=861532 RepID=A0ABS4GK68_9BACL|nr:SAM-dependent methyltransferase [Ammoniphilus resinae]MBP1930639.1 SAM-dependent MidA family methyltransferase [Ammoniphilus resinae]
MSSLFTIIKEKIKSSERHSISFYDFMALALYHPEWGYYSKEKKKVGKQGDFYTNSSVGSIFGETLAAVIAEMAKEFSHLKRVTVVEMGGGTGELMKQILEEWKTTFPNFDKKISLVMIEKSSYHRSVQKEKLADYPVVWYEDWEEFVRIEGNVKGIVYSNELFDAFPVYMIERVKDDWKEVRISWDDAGECLTEFKQELKNQEVINFLEEQKLNLPNIQQYRVEVNLDAVQLINKLSLGLAEGYLITIDYGYAHEELYMPERQRGTLMCYKEHLALENPLEQPGEMDMTTHINFSTLIAEGEKLGLKNLGLFSQSQFLINAGILDKLADHQDPNPFSAVSRRNRAIRQLIFPGGMGDTFKVLVQMKGKVSNKLQKLQPRGWFK